MIGGWHFGRLAAVTVLAAPFLVPIMASGQGIDHDGWEALLQRHVVETGNGASTAVDYAGMASDRLALQRYLGQTAVVDRGEFRQWSESDQLAFLINVYNAQTVELILTAWPELESIRDLGGLLESPWEIEFFELLGKRRSLDELEHEMIRGHYDEPRIHFAVNCASIGCPALSREAYEGGRLDRQLEAATRRFLGDRSRNRLEGGVLYASPIFDWYRADFESGFRRAESLAGFLSLYGDSLGLAASEQRALRQGDIDIRYLAYDWQLNSTAGGDHP